MHQRDNHVTAPIHRELFDIDIKERVKSQTGNICQVIVF